MNCKVYRGTKDGRPAVTFYPHAVEVTSTEQEAANALLKEVFPVYGKDFLVPRVVTVSSYDKYCCSKQYCHCP